MFRTKKNISHFLFLLLLLLLLPPNKPLLSLRPLSLPEKFQLGIRGPPPPSPPSFAVCDRTDDVGIGEEREILKREQEFSDHSSLANSALFATCACACNSRLLRTYLTFRPSQGDKVDVKQEKVETKKGARTSSCQAEGIHSTTSEPLPPFRERQ